MVAYRQPIRPGDVGRDVTAVKRTLVRMGIKGAGGMAMTDRAGPAFVACLKICQRQHGLAARGTYDMLLHSVVAPHFKAYENLLYRTAKNRSPPVPPLPDGTAQVEAKKLIALHGQGKYHADNPADMGDLVHTANGQPVWSQGGYWVHIDPRPLRLLVWLIESKGYKIGTYAICSDHHDDGRSGHAGGLAVDISSINGISVAAPTAHDVTLKVAQLLHSREEGGLVPRQLICGGYGNMSSSDIAACTIPSPSFYGSVTMGEHRNHIHCGF